MKIQQDREDRQRRQRRSKTSQNALGDRSVRVHVYVHLPDVCMTQEVSFVASACVATDVVGDRQRTHQDCSQVDASSKDLCFCFLFIPKHTFLSQLLSTHTIKLDLRSDKTLISSVEPGLGAHLAKQL